VKDPAHYLDPHDIFHSIEVPILGQCEEDVDAIV